MIYHFVKNGYLVDEDRFAVIVYSKSKGSPMIIVQEAETLGMNCEQHNLGADDCFNDYSYEKDDSYEHFVAICEKEFKNRYGVIQEEES
jgi:hypothetical protein